MTDLGQVINAAGSVVTGAAALGALAYGFFNRRAAAQARERATAAAEAARAAKVAAEASQAEIIATKEGVFEVGKQIDGRLSELLKLTEASALAKGRLEGTATEKARVAEKAEQDPHLHKRNGDGT